MKIIAEESQDIRAEQVQEYGYRLPKDIYISYIYVSYIYIYSYTFHIHIGFIGYQVSST